MRGVFGLERINVNERSACDVEVLVEEEKEERYAHRMDLISRLGLRISMFP